MANNTQTTASLLDENHREEKRNHIETKERMYLQDNAEPEYVKSGNVIRLCAFIVARPKFAFGELFVFRVYYNMFSYFQTLIEI
jgi:hypothetical protein